MRSISLLVGFVALAACSDDGSEMEGLYTIDTNTRNDAACDVEGPAVTSGNTAFFIRWQEFFAYKALAVVECATLEECEVKYDDKDTLHLGGVALDRGDDDSGWTSESAFATDFSGECTGIYFAQRLEKADDSSVRVEQRSHPILPFPAGSGDDACPEAMALANGKDQPCMTYEVLTGTRI